MTTKEELIYGEIIDPLIGLYSPQKLKLRNSELAKLAEREENTQRFREHRRNPKNFSKINANIANLNKEVEEKKIKHDKIRKKILKTDKINVNPDIMYQAKQQRESKLPKVGDIYSTKANYHKTYQVIVLKVDGNKIEVVSKDIREYDDETNESFPEIQTLDIKDLIIKKGAVNKDTKMIDETKNELIKRRLI